MTSHTDTKMLREGSDGCQGAWAPALSPRAQSDNSGFISIKIRKQPLGESRSIYHR